MRLRIRCTTAFPSDFSPLHRCSYGFFGSIFCLSHLCLSCASNKVISFPPITLEKYEVNLYKKHAKRQNIPTEEVSRRIKDFQFGMLHSVARKYIRFEDTEEKKSGSSKTCKKYRRSHREASENERPPANRPKLSYSKSINLMVGPGHWFRELSSILISELNHAPSS